MKALNPKHKIVHLHNFSYTANRRQFRNQNAMKNSNYSTETLIYMYKINA